MLPVVSKTHLFEPSKAPITENDSMSQPLENFHPQLFSHTFSESFPNLIFLPSILHLSFLTVVCYDIKVWTAGYTCQTVTHPASLEFQYCQCPVFRNPRFETSAHITQSRNLNQTQLSIVLWTSVIFLSILSNCVYNSSLLKVGWPIFSTDSTPSYEFWTFTLCQYCL